MCGSAPGKDDKGLQEDSCPGAADSFIPKEKIWKGVNVLKVFFFNVEFIDNWKSKGEPMNVNTIIAWANAWQPWKGAGIPRFERTELVNKADIRVKFTSQFNSVLFCVHVCTVLALVPGRCFSN